MVLFLVHLYCVLDLVLASYIIYQAPNTKCAIINRALLACRVFSIVCSTENQCFILLKVAVVAQSVFLRRAMQYGTGLSVFRIPNYLSSAAK